MKKFLRVKKQVTYCLPFKDHLTKKELKKLKKEKKKSMKLEKDIEKFEHIESIVEGGKNHRLEGENAEYSEGASIIHIFIINS